MKENLSASALRQLWQLWPTKLAVSLYIPVPSNEGPCWAFPEHQAQRHAALSYTVTLTKNLISSCLDFDGLVQERRNSIANALELHLSCTIPPTSSTNPSSMGGLVHERRNSIANALELRLSCTIPPTSSTNPSSMGGLVQERHNSIANALELRLSCTNPPMSFFH